jgi:hypothetical protein
MIDPRLAIVSRRLTFRTPSPLAADTVIALPSTPSTTPRSSSAQAYWITSSAWKRSVGGNVIPSA